MLLLLASCAGELDNPERFLGGDQVGDIGPLPSGGCVDDYAVVDQLLPGRCGTATCHAAVAQPAAGLDLSAVNVADRVAGQPSSYCPDKVLVAPGKPAASYLVDKVAGDETICGDPMPRGGDPLSDEELACLRQWIAELK